MHGTFFEDTFKNAKVGKRPKRGTKSSNFGASFFDRFLESRSPKMALALFVIVVVIVVVTVVVFVVVDVVFVVAVVNIVVVAVVVVVVVLVVALLILLLLVLLLVLLLLLLLLVLTDTLNQHLTEVAESNGCKTSTVLSHRYSQPALDRGCKVERVQDVNDSNSRILSASTD